MYFDEILNVEIGFCYGMCKDVFINKLMII